MKFWQFWKWKLDFAKKAGEVPPAALLLTIIMTGLVTVSLFFTLKSCDISNKEMYKPRTFSSEQIKGQNQQKQGESQGIK